MKHILLSAAAFTLIFSACEKKPETENSAVRVTEVKHSKTVKQQTINNCWIYSAASWMESLSAITTEEELNVSESYWAYWHWYHQLAVDRTRSLEVGGGWGKAKEIIKEYGWVKESEFIAAESGAVLSERQECAEAKVLEELKEGGRLWFAPGADNFKEIRSPEKVRAVLDEAFTCKEENQKIDGLAVQKEHKKSAEGTMFKVPGKSDLQSLAVTLEEWDYIQPKDNFNSKSKKALPTARDQRYYDALEKAIKQALNDGQPVVIGFQIDFNAVDQNGLFNLSTYAAQGAGTKGAHMVVLSDYTVKDAPNYGTLPEGNLSAEKKQAAIEGKLEYLVAKNSWGSTESRKDRPWIRDGYSRISWDFLTKGFVVAETSYDGVTSEVYSQILTAVVIPKQYKVIWTP